MNYIPYVSWGMYGGTTAAQRANLLVSWGLADELASYLAGYCGLLVLGPSLEL